MTKYICIQEEEKTPEKSISYRCDPTSIKDKQYENFPAKKYYQRF